MPEEDFSAVQPPVSCVSAEISHQKLSPQLDCRSQSLNQSGPPAAAISPATRRGDGPEMFFVYMTVCVCDLVMKLKCSSFSTCECANVSELAVGSLQVLNTEVLTAKCRRLPGAF